ncbi:hypothetical protein G647_02928 [Cladophialophora carrionii CBS 160.54]|uniref:Extracellular membrane protein CFEM domain-containing protein n=1 Tax=Cladophialophora carrionii CBS 160.54 TaxID=1279043 RepID=V9DHI3_9EURO|nr:uncharacterized protein G647_02928 [Cladophialophora carrionii CBS 160.54]ETI26151.1 hypothetical protein G647_02928 [Cladophialophora carrionii CBS 160.54]
MRFFPLVIGAVSLAFVSASSGPSVFSSLLRRQEPGTPQYDCHANCGNVIVAGRTEGYCDTANFTTSLDACLGCALEFDIWQYYGDSVSEAATACGLDATPAPANATDTATATATTNSSGPESTSMTETASQSSSTEASTSSSSSSVTTSSSVEVATATGGQAGMGGATGSAAPAEETAGSLGNKVALSGGLAALPLVALLLG